MAANMAANKQKCKRLGCKKIATNGVPIEGGNILPLCREHAVEEFSCEVRTRWYSVKDKKPYCSRDPEALGTQVLIWPHFQSAGSAPDVTAFYGRRCTGKPEFYKYGAVMYGVTHWMPLPEGPTK